MSRSSFATILVLPLVSLSFALLSCGSDGQRPGVVTRGKVLPFNIAERDLALSRHTILQLAQTRRLMDVVLGSEIKMRIAGKIGSESDEGVGCQRIRKLSPDPERSGTTFAESFQVFSRRCTEDSTELTAGGELSGTETFEVSYQKRFPKPIDSDQSFGLPDSVGVRSEDLKYTLSPKTAKMDQLTVVRAYEFHARMIAEDETTATYNAVYDGKDTYEYDVQRDFRSGKLATKLLSFEIKVSKTSMRVISVHVAPDSMSLDVQVTTFLKSEYSLKRSTLTPGAEANLQLVLSPIGELAWPTSSCEAISGKFKMKKTVGETVSEETITTTGGEIQTASADKVGKLSVCAGQITQPAFIEALESVYY